MRLRLTFNKSGSLSDPALKFMSRNNAVKVSGALQQKKNNCNKKRTKERNQIKCACKLWGMTMACAENQPPAIAASANSEQDVFFFFLRGTKSKLIKDTGSNGSGESASRAATAMQSLQASSLRVRNVVQIRGKQTAGIRQRRQLALSCARKRVIPSGLNASLRKKHSKSRRYVAFTTRRRQRPAARQSARNGAQIAPRRGDTSNGARGTGDPRQRAPNETAHAKRTGLAVTNH